MVASFTVKPDGPVPDTRIVSWPSLVVPVSFSGSMVNVEAAVPVSDSAGIVTVDGSEPPSV